ncbi:MAG: hypothetical protein EON87_02720 [Brevundimonas sp.]|nr:MAG: hypothetical protein EON87_02720 [Brevundimonas sp.]
MDHAAAFAASLVIITLAAGASAAQTVSPPSGVMTLYSGNTRGANFLIDDSVVRDGARVSYSNFRVFAEPIDVPTGPITMDVESLVLDCDTRRVTVSGIEAFGGSGEHIASLPGYPAADIEANDSWDFAARILCDGVEPPPTQKRTGWRAAHEIALFMIARAT